MKNLEGCLTYLGSTATEEPNAVLVYEVWYNEDAHH